MRYVLGVDGGNSKTLAVVADERGQVLGVGRGGGSNHQTIGFDPALREVRDVACRALGLAGVAPAEIEAAFFGLAGADLPEDFALLTPALRELHLASRMELDNDSIPPLRAAAGSPTAVVVVWGAGTNAAGRNARGEQIRLPALGWISGDWGGGGDLGREAIRLVVRAHDGRGQSTALRDLVLPVLGAADVDDLVRKLHFGDIPYGAIVALAPLVFTAAGAGDPVACTLVERAAEEVAVTAVALLRRLGALEVPADVVLSGSTFKAEGTLFLDAIRRRLAEVAPRARAFVPDIEPVLGSVFCAMELIGTVPDDSVRARARTSYERLLASLPMPGVSTTTSR